MYIGGLQRVQDTARLKAKGRTEAHGRFALDTPAEAAASGAPAPLDEMGSLVSVDALLALQAEDDPAERRRRAIVHGEDLLDRLDAVKLDLLAGTLSAEALRRLSLAVERSLEAVEDPRLAAILGEIDLRARVELAKHRHLL